MTQKDIAEGYYNQGFCNTLRPSFSASFLDSLLEECEGRTENVVSFLDSLFYVLNRNIETDWLERVQEEQDKIDWEYAQELKDYEVTCEASYREAKGF